MEKTIVVLDRGFVFIGAVVRGDPWTTIGDPWITIEDAKCIRYWGTTKGLGQLALEGPQPKTILDETGTVTAPVSSVIALIDVRSDKW